MVDIYNEGVDIPEVNTVLFLRPTESLTVFLQQLGRGLRLAENKDCLTVLDFIGQANKKYNFDEKFAALLSNTTRSVSRELKEGFVSALKAAIFSWRNMPQNMCWIISAPPMTAPPGLWRGRLPSPRILVCP